MIKMTLDWNIRLRSIFCNSEAADSAGGSGSVVKLGDDVDEADIDYLTPEVCWRDYIGSLLGPQLLLQRKRWEISGLRMLFLYRKYLYL